MKKISSSLAAKLVIAFILVAMPPMLLASRLASSLLIDVVNMNIEEWLDTANQFIFRSIDETVEELSATHFLLHQRFAGEALNLSEDEIKAFADLGADIIIVRDAGGNVLYANQAVSASGEQLYPGSVLAWVSYEDGRRTPAVVVERGFTALDGNDRTLMLASPFTVRIANSGHEDPIEMRILLPSGNGLEEVYASREEEHGALAPQIWHSLFAGAETVYLPGSDLTDSAPDDHILFTPVRGDDGSILAVWATSAFVLPYEGLPSPSFVFWGLFLLGTFFSGGMGYILARRLTKPIASLSMGVAGIAAGELEHRVAVSGDDEIAELGNGFNLMARQLAVMQREKAESARAERATMLGEIALGFAHEIRNPLVVIKTSAEVVHKTLPKEGKEARLLGFVVEETRRIDTLISEFLAFAKPEPIRMQPFSLKALAGEVLEMCTPELERKHIRWTLADDSSEGSAFGEPNQFRQVLLNLVFNAADAMPEGGVLTISLREDADTVTLEVSDTGTGIPEDRLETVFTPFMTTKQSGLGLGLAKVRAIVESHGGRVYCSSTPGKGTVFTINLNLHPPV